MQISKKQIAKQQDQEQKRSAVHVANNPEQAGWVRDRKTGEWYDPEVKFREMMNDPEVQAQFCRMKER